MALEVGEMALDEVDLIIDYFHGGTPEFHEQLGVDPTRLPSRERWRERYVREYEKPYTDRETLLVIWREDGEPSGSRPATGSCTASRRGCTSTSPSPSSDARESEPRGYEERPRSTSIGWS